MILGIFEKVCCDCVFCIVFSFKHMTQGGFPPNPMCFRNDVVDVPSSPAWFFWGKKWDD